jgi:sec-independent protein translocase protein TatA
VFALILESIGTTELIFILAIALIFFGPRKLPQLAKSMGKGLAEFRKASDDFKRTWEREVALETASVDESSLLETQEPVTYESYGQASTDTPEPELIAADPEQVIPRESAVETASEAPLEVQDIPAESAQPEPVRKQEWI